MERPLGQAAQGFIHQVGYSSPYQSTAGSDDGIAKEVGARGARSVNIIRGTAGVWAALRKHFGEG